MTKTRLVEWKGKSVALRAIKNGEKFMASRKRYGFTDICPICREKLEVRPQELILVISNQANIPNQILHQECTTGKTDDEVVDFLGNDFEEFKKSSKRFAAWIK